MCTIWAQLLVFLLIVHFQKVAPNTCQEVFSIEQPAEGSYQGIINFDLHYDTVGLWVNVEFDNKLDLLSSSLGAVTTKNNQKYFIVNEEAQLPKNEFSRIDLKVLFNAALTRPTVSKVVINGLVKCSPNMTQKSQATTAVKQKVKKQEIVVVKHEIIPFIDIED